MNNSVREVEKESFLIEDIIVNYSNIQITHANDNRTPASKLIRKIVFWGCFLALCGILIFY